MTTDLDWPSWELDDGTVLHVGDEVAIRSAESTDMYGRIISPNDETRLPVVLILSGRPGMRYQVTPLEEILCKHVQPMRNVSRGVDGSPPDPMVPNGRPPQYARPRVEPVDPAEAAASPLALGPDVTPRAPTNGRQGGDQNMLKDLYAPRTAPAEPKTDEEELVDDAE